MKKYLNIEFHPSSKSHILEKIDKYIPDKDGFMHIVSLNPENMVIAQTDDEYRNILSQSDIQIVDGIGVTLGSVFLGISSSGRITGVDLMQELIKLGAKKGLRILLLGGKANLAEKLALCYKKKYNNLSVKGIMGFQNILNPTIEEKHKIFSIVADYKPQIVLAAYGSPAQEKWFFAHRKRFSRSICVGVGGAFDYLSGEVVRAPFYMRNIGLEWLYRLVRQPWRWRRQLRLITFIGLICRQKYNSLCI